MSNSRAAFKVSDQIVSRLFDHRQFTTGQIDYLVKGFDNACLEDNLEKLLKINEKVCVVLDQTQSESLTTINRDISVDRKTDVSELVSIAEQILRFESRFKDREEKMLSEVRAQRQKSIDNCKLTLDEKLRKFVESLEAGEEELRKKYSKLEETLMKNNPI